MRDPLRWALSAAFAALACVPAAAATLPATAGPDWQPPTLTELLKNSTMVLEVRMHKNGATRDESGHITTDWNMEVLNVLYPPNRQETKNLRFRTAGGCIGDKCETIVGWPYFDQGERAIAFLRPNASDPLRLETTSGAEGWFHADSVSAGLRALWSEDGEGNWTVGWANCPGGGWISRRTVWMEASGRRTGRHEMPIADLRDTILKLAAPRQSLARAAR